SVKPTAIRLAVPAATSNASDTRGEPSSPLARSAVSPALRLPIARHTRMRYTIAAASHAISAVTDHDAPPTSATARAATAAPVARRALRSAPRRLATAIRRRHDQDRPVRMLGNLVRDASLERLADAVQAARAHDDHRCVDLIGDVDDAAVCGRSELCTSFGVESDTAGALGAVTCPLQRLVRVQLLECIARNDRRQPGQALPRPRLPAHVDH